MILGQFHFDFLNLYTRFYSINEEQFAYQLSTLFNKLRRNRMLYRNINYLQIIMKGWQNE